MDSTGLETEGVLLVLPGVRNALQQPLEVEIGGLLSVQDGFDDVGGEEGKVEDAGGAMRSFAFYIAATASRGAFLLARPSGNPVR